MILAFVIAFALLIGLLALAALGRPGGGPWRDPDKHVRQTFDYGKGDPRR